MLQITPDQVSVHNLCISVFDDYIYTSRFYLPTMSQYGPLTQPVLQDAKLFEHDIIENCVYALIRNKHAECSFLAGFNFRECP